jgi:phosphoesterase RecJ-like protein
MSGGREVDCEAALEESLGLPHAQIALMLRENRNGTIKGSLRSGGDIDVESIARAFGGGGHRHAAGFDVKNRVFQELYDEVVIIIKEEFR